MGVRVPLALDGVQGPEPFLRALLSGVPESDPRRRCSRPRAARRGSPRIDAWIVEAGDALQSCCDSRASSAPGSAHTALSYARLRDYRDELTRSLYKKVLAASGPQELAAYVREPGRIRRNRVRSCDTDEVLRAFVRDVFLGGNGTLLVNNTFVEWSAVQALKRAQPRLLVARFGVRDKMKPFSSLLLFSSPRATDQVPILEDPFGSFVDVEQLVVLRVAQRREERRPTAAGRSTCSSRKAWTRCSRFVRVLPALRDRSCPKRASPTSAQRWRAGWGFDRPRNLDGR